MSHYHMHSSSHPADATVLSHRQNYAKHLDITHKERSIEKALADYLFTAEMYAVERLVARQKFKRQAGK